MQLWSLSRLSEARNVADPPGQTGARFIASFVKNRNSTVQECPPLEWRLDNSNSASESGQTTVEWKTPSTLEIFRRWLEEGLSTAGEIATEMGVSRPIVSRLARQAERAGWLTKKGREYVLLQPSPQSSASFAE